MIRWILALLALGAGLYFFHDVSVFEGVMASRGDNSLADLLREAPFALRFVGGLLVTIGGALSFRAGIFGPIIMLFGTLCFVLLTGAMVALGADISLWQDELVTAGGLAALCAGLFIFRR